MEIKSWFDKDTCTLTYCVFDPSTKDAVVIDPVWNFDPASGVLSTHSVHEVINFVKEAGLKLHFILETHAHADHLSGAMPLHRAFPEARVAIGRHITKVQETFQKIFNLGDDFATDGRQFDLLLEDGGVIVAGSLAVKSLFTPGHTPACSSLMIGDALFVGDALFMPDYGTGRCDFPQGNAEDLYDSIQKLYALPDATRVFTGHDYQPGGRPLRWQSTIAEEKTQNIQIKATTTRAAYTAMRRERDLTLSAPRLLLTSIQVNISGGQLPRPESNGVSYLKLPLSLKS